MTEDEKKYEDVISTLKGLQQVKAHPNFEADLKRRLNTEKYAKEKRNGFRKLLMPSRIIPSFGLAAAAIIVFMIININSEDADNPFLMEPKVREDVLLISEIDDAELPEGNLSGENGGAVEERVEENTRKEKSSGTIKDESSVDENLIASREFSPAESTLTNETDAVEKEEFSAPPATGFAIKKSGLNFRQVNLTEIQQKEIVELKKKVQTKTEKTDIE